MLGRGVRRGERSRASHRESRATDFGAGIRRVSGGKIRRHMSVVTGSSALICSRQAILNTLSWVCGFGCRERPDGPIFRSILGALRGENRGNDAAGWKFSLVTNFAFARQAKNRAKINAFLATNLLTADSVNPIGCGLRAGKPHPVVVSKALISSSNLLSPLASVRKEHPLNYSFFPFFYFSFHAKNLSSRLQDLRP